MLALATVSMFALFSSPPPSITMMRVMIVRAVMMVIDCPSLSLAVVVVVVVVDGPR